MTEIDWDNAPEGAGFYAQGFYRRISPINFIPERFSVAGGEWVDGWVTLDDCIMSEDYSKRPQPKPPVTHQEAISGQAERPLPVTAAHFLESGLRILTERGQQYGSNERECSFPQVAEAFNAITGKQLLGSDICLILALVKQVRQYAQPGRFHEDSAIDGVNYTALQAELLKKERGE